MPVSTTLPVSRTYARSLMRSAAFAFCSTRRMVIPCARSTFLTVSKICATRMGAMPMEGSSIISMRGRLMSARPMASICCSPPESVPPCCANRCFRIGNMPQTRSTSASMASVSLRMNAPISRFSRTVRRGKMRRPSGTCTRPRRTTCSGAMEEMSVPSNSMRPLARLMREMHISVVDLPAPLAPIRLTISPGKTSMSTPCSTSACP